MIAPIQFARMATLDNVKLLPPDIRETFIRAILGAKRCVVEYVDGGTKCPVCSMFGLIGDVRINSTNAEKRSCECRRCTATFTAIGTPDRKKKRRKKR